MFPLSAKSERIVIAAILALAIALRVVAAMVLPDQSHLLNDVLGFRDTAAGLLTHWQMANLHQMPAYPLLIAVTGPGIGQLAADIALSVISVWLVYALARKLFADQVATVCAGIAAACYPPLIFFSVVGLSETLFIMLVLAAFLFWYRGSFTGAAVAAVLAILTRPIFDLFVPALVLWFALVVHRLSLTQALRWLAVYVIVYCSLIMPWWLNNLGVYGTFVRLTPGAGMVLYAGNNPLNRSGGGNVGVDYDLSAFMKIADPVERDRALRNAAFAYIIEHPQRFLELAGLKFVRIWPLWPTHEGYANVATILFAIASIVPALLLAGIGLILKRHMVRRLSPILLFGLGYTVVHMALAGTIRYRLALESFLLIFSGAAAGYLIRTVGFGSAPWRNQLM